MVPNTQWMGKMFDTYNAKYFGGQLPRPRFRVAPLNGEWGRFFLDAKFDRRGRIYNIKNGNGELILTSRYDRDEKSIIGTMLHEMIHEYIFLVMGIWPRNQHGKEFNSLARRINADGWNISEANEMMDTDKEINGDYAEESSDDIPPQQQRQPQQQCIICYFNFQSRGINYWGCKLDMNQRNAAMETIKSIGGKDAHFYTCYSRALANMEPNDPSKLNGFGGDTIRDVAQKFANWTGDDIEYFEP